MICYPNLSGLKLLVGQELGLSGWVTVEQDRINGFADATGDHQWIHVDPLRAAQGPFGKTIAHGYLTLSLLPALAERAFRVDDVRMGVNYGLNRVRFITPVPAGSQIRARFRLLAFEPIDGGAQLTMEASLELGGASRPACVAETLSRLFT